MFVSHFDCLQFESRGSLALSDTYLSINRNLSGEVLCSSAAPDLERAIDTACDYGFPSQVYRSHKVIVHTQHLPVASTAT